MERMKRKSAKSLVLLILVFLIVGCDAAESSPDDSTINAGASFVDGSDLISPMTGIGYTVEANQPLVASFTVYVGAIPGFANIWAKYLAECNPGFDKFAIHRIIENDTEQLVAEKYIVLDDFPNDKKYPMHYESLEDGSQQTFIYYDWFTADIYDFDSIDIEMGYIYYTLSYYDGVNDQPFYGSAVGFGTYGGWKVKFKKQGDRVIFSL